MTDGVSFENSGLPQDTRVETAYNLVRHLPRAIGSARILTEMIRIPETVAGHLLAFAEPRIDLADIARDYGSKASRMVGHIRRYHDEKADILQLGCSAATEASLIACALWDAEQQMLACKGHPLSAAFMSVSQTAQGVAIKRASVEELLREARRNIEYPYLVLAQMSGFASLTNRVRQTLRKLDVMIATAPEEPSAVVKKDNTKGAPKR